jgi:signal transduction histidine kinase/ActR/RegA family two-component response regulator
LANLASRLAANVADQLVERIRAASTSQKLGLAFALFLAPLAFVSSTLVAEQQDDLDSALLEREGAAYLRVVNDTADLLRAEMRASDLGQNDLDALRRGARALQRAEAMYGEDLETAELSQRTIHALRLMQANPHARNAAGDAAAVGLSDLGDRIGDRSGLLRDPDRASYFAANIALEQAPALATIAREIADIAQQALEDGRVNQDERATVQRMLVTLQDRVQTLSNSADAIIEDGGDLELASALGRATSNLLANFEGLRASVTSTLERRHPSSHDMLAREAGSQLVLTALRGLVADEFDTMLADRIDRLRTNRNGTLLLAAFLFLIAMTSVVVLLRKQLVEPIGSLSNSIRELAAGHYDADIPALSRGDEIGDMARAVVVLRDAAKERFAADAARAAAESASAAKTQFVASMSHELRTPLNAILGYSEMLSEDAADRGDASAQDDLARITGAARHLLGVINDILDLSKIEAGRMDILPARCDPEAIAADVAATTRPLADKHGNTLIIDLAPVRTAFTDAQKLRQCLFNLLSNACKFTKSGTVTVTMGLENRSNENWLVFNITDTGIGISPEQMKSLFTPFVQADSKITRDFGGTGLGLAITRRMARLMGGDVTVESEAGEGAIFRLSIPQFYEGMGREEAVDRFQRVGEVGAPLILVVDDEADARDLVARTLTPAGFAVQGARTAEAALILAKEVRPCLVLADIRLPGRSGWDLIADLRADPATNDIPIVVLSIDCDRRRALDLGAAEHLVKPATRELLCATIMRLARARTHAPDASAPGALAKSA